MNKMTIYQDGCVILWEGKEMVGLMWNPTISELELLANQYEVEWK